MRRGGLPREPVDQYNLQWWTCSTQLGVIDHRAVYHVNTLWEQAEETEGRHAGADFVNQWQVFDKGRFVGRSGYGWNSIQGCLTDTSYTSVGRARVAYRTLLHRRISQLMVELDEMWTKLKAVGI